MANVVESKKIVGKKKQKRPDGTDPARYKNLENLSYREWAWEFLRRNDDFIAECKRVDSCNEDEKQAVARQFELKKFKRYSEQYKGGSGSPRFKFSSISRWINFDCENKKGRLARIRICPGQVVIRFNLASMIKDKKALEKQIRLAKQVVNKNLATYEKLINEEAKIHKHKCVNFGIYIRLLDYLAMNKSPLECAKLVYPNRTEQTDYYLGQYVKSPIEAAKKMASDGYIYLSILNGKPKGKGIPLEL